MRRLLSALSALAAAAGCTPAPAPLAPGEPPNLVLWIADGAASDAFEELGGARFPDTFSAQTAAADDHRVILTSAWPVGAASARPSTLPSVLSLYGYRTEAVTAPGFVEDPSLLAAFDAARLGRCGEPPALPEREPFLLLVHRPAGCGDSPSLLRELRGWAPERTAVIAVGPAAVTAPDESSRAPLAIRDPRSDEAGAVAGLGTTLDVMPAALALAGAVVPSDAWGAVPGQRRRDAIFQRGAGQVAIRTERHRLLVAEAALSAGCAGGTLIGIGGASTEGALGPLCQALSAWRQDLDATSARERLGSEDFRHMLREGGYW